MMENASDPEFAAQLAAARAGSHAASGWLFARARPYLLAVAEGALGPGLRDKVGGSDVVQDSLLKAHCLLERFQGDREEEFRAWLRALVLNAVGDVHRRYRKTARRGVGREASLDAAGAMGRLREMLTGSGESPSQALSREERASALAGLVAALPGDYARVIQLRAWEGLSFPEIGQRMDRSEDAVRMLWGRAIRRLQDDLEGPDGSKVVG